jgi:hypothetical protein
VELSKTNEIAYIPVPDTAAAVDNAAKFEGVWRNQSAGEVFKFNENRFTQEEDRDGMLRSLIGTFTFTGSEITFYPYGWSTWTSSYRINGNTLFLNWELSKTNEIAYIDPTNNYTFIRHKEYPFALSSDRKELSINIFNRGPKGDKWVLQDDENKGTFPIGKWVNTNNMVVEFLLFTSTELTISSNTFDTWRYDYSISGANLVLSGSQFVPYVPTEAEKEYIDNFHLKYEAAFRAAHPWIPVTSSITPQGKIKREDMKPVINGQRLGIQFHIVDHPDMTFVNDPDVIGTWTAVDYVSDYTGFNPAVPQDPDRNNGRALRFEANGKFDNNGKWTKGILQVDDTALEYEIKTYGADRYMFVQDKQDYYGVPRQKLYYDVFKKDK